VAIDEEFKTALFSEDELGAVVRAHIYIESTLIQFLESRVDEPKHLPRLRFEQRVRLARSLLLSEDLFEPLIQLGNVRNKFGHNIHACLTKADVASMYRACSEGDRARMEASYLKTYADMPEAKFRPYDELSAKEQFILMAIFLNTSIRIELDHALALRKRRVPDSSGRT